MISSNGTTYFASAISIILLYVFANPAFSFSCRSIGRSPRQVGTGTGLSATFSSNEQGPEFEQHPPNRHAEFRDLEPIVESEARRARMKQDRKLRGRYAKHGDDLWSLRKVTADLSQRLVKAINSDSREKEESIREKLRQLESQDPELVYKMELLKMKRAINEDREEEVKECRTKAMEARSQLPHFNLEGLWVGK